jgi:hypothetical protein
VVLRLSQKPTQGRGDERPGYRRYLGIALQKRESSLVAFSDKEGVARVRTNFLKKKLGLTNPDAELDKAIMAIADKMKGDRTKNSVS